MKVRKDENYKEYYELNEVIYKGPHSTIYKGTDKKSCELRAIKIINLNIIEKEFSKIYNKSETKSKIQDFIDGIIYEFEKMNECSYNNINSAQYYELFVNKNEILFIMELCDDNISNILLKNKKGFTPKEIYKIMRQLNNTFKLVSKKDYILKNIEPENLLIKYKGDKKFIIKLSNYIISPNNSKIFSESKGTSKISEKESEIPGNNKDYLLNIGVLIYRLFFIKSPIKEKNNIPFKKLEKTGNKELDDLIESLLLKDKIISFDWENYFNHPFFIKDYIKLVYKINANEEKIKLFGDKFIEDNINLKNKLKIIYSKKEFEFQQFFDVKNICKDDKNILKIKLKGINELINISYMFDECESLLSVLYFSNWNFSKINNMKCMFNRCKNLQSLFDISNLNTSQVGNMGFLFSRCKSLISLPDLSIWDTSKVFNMSYMFYRCKSLLSLPNISKWNYSNVIYISNMFGRCKKLSITPKITIKENKKFFSSDLKIIVIGTSGCDKAQFVNKWTKNTFNDMYKATIVSEFGFKIFEYGDDLYRIQLWDLAGQDKNAMVTKIFAKDAKGVVVMSDATNIQTREDTIKWKNSVDDVVKFIDGKDIPCILVENKIDLLPDDDHYDPTFEEFYKNNGFTKGFRVSSKTGENVDEAMKFLIKTIIKRNETYLEKIDDICDNLSGDRKVIIDFENHDEPETKTKRKIIKKGCY